MINKNITTTGDITLKSNAGISTAAAIAASGGNPAVPAVLITAKSISGGAGGAVTLNTQTSSLGEFTVTGGNNFTLTNDGALVVNGAVALTNAAGASGAISLTITGTGNGITTSEAVGAVGSIAAASLAVTSQGEAILTGLDIRSTAGGTTTYGAITGSAKGAVTLAGAFGSASGFLQQADGAFKLKNSQNLTNLALPNRSLNVKGAVSYETTGTATISFAAPTGGATALNFGEDNIFITSAAALAINENITTTGNIHLSSGAGVSTSAGKKIAAATLTGSAAGAVNLNASVTNLGAFTVTGSNNFSLTNDKVLNISGAVTDSAGTVNLVVTTGGISKSDGGKNYGG